MNFARQCFQDAIVHKLSADGSPQYFLLDSADMEKIVARLEKIVDFKPVGIYSTYKPVKIMKLDPYAKWRLYPSAECAQ